MAQSRRLPELRMRLVSLLLALTFAAPVVAQNSGVDRRFGVNGILSLRDQAQASNLRHLGLAACAAPDGGLNVLAASSLEILTLYRLDFRGELDMTFANGGITTIAVPPSGEDTAQGACMADGRIVVVRHAPGLGNDKNTQVMRILPDGGLDPTFAQGGTLTLDFDQHAAGLGDLEFPLGLNLDAEGNILVSMRVFLAGGQSRPALASFDVGGNLRFARLYEPAGFTAVYASLAGLGPNGRLWLVGGGNPHGTPFNSWFRSEIDPLDGDLLATFVGTDGNYIVDGGRVLPSGVMVAVGKYVPQSEPGGAYRPRLMVFRESGFSAVVLPQPVAVNDFEPSLAPFPGHGVAIPIADGRVLFGAPLGAQNGEWELATYAAVVELGATAAQDRVDTRFGFGGAVQFAYRTPSPCANGSPTLQRPVRFSNWRGRPVLAGIHATTCSVNPRNAFVARLLAPSDIFMDTFED
jgi:hypothetical protein